MASALLTGVGIAFLFISALLASAYIFVGIRVSRVLDIASATFIVGAVLLISGLFIANFPN